LRQVPNVVSSASPFNLQLALDHILRPKRISKTFCVLPEGSLVLAAERSFAPQQHQSARLKARQIRFIVLSPTTRSSILSIRSERSTSAALMAAIVCRKVLTFDPSDTMPPSTVAIDPMRAI